MSPVEIQPDKTPARPTWVFLTFAQKSWLLTGGVVVLIAAVAKLLVHLYASRRYGYFTDELYYLDCARHLAWGYVDQPPLIAAMTWLGAKLFGESLGRSVFFPR
jgi:hypothetical protein